MSLAAFFPPLDSKRSNPDTWLSIEAGSRAYRWRYVYYNTRLFRNRYAYEYRLTYVRDYLAGVGAAVGDTLELQQLGADTYGASIVRAPSENDPIVLTIMGRWSLIKVTRT